MGKIRLCLKNKKGSCDKTYKCIVKVQAKEVYPNTLLRLGKESKYKSSQNCRRKIPNQDMIEERITMEDHLKYILGWDIDTCIGNINSSVLHYLKKCKYQLCQITHLPNQLFQIDSNPLELAGIFERAMPTLTFDIANN